MGEREANEIRARRAQEQTAAFGGCSGKSRLRLPIQRLRLREFSRPQGDSKLEAPCCSRSTQTLGLAVHSVAQHHINGSVDFTAKLLPSSPASLLSTISQHCIMLSMPKRIPSSWFPTSQGLR